MLLFLAIICSSSITGDKKYHPKPWGFEYVPKSKGAPSFWMKSMEVANWEYRDYLEGYLLSGDTIGYQIAYPDTAFINSHLWVSKEIPYFEHWIFDDFPVVGLTRGQMEMYAEWLGRWYREEFPGWKMDISLPTKTQWRIAATADTDISEKYFHGLSYRNSKGCNLMWFYDNEDRDIIGTDSQSNLGYFLPENLEYDFRNEWYKLNMATDYLKKLKPKKFYKSLPLAGLPVANWSYFPNTYGLYNLTGNVAEMVLNQHTGKWDAVGGSFRTSPIYCRTREELPYPYDANQVQIDVGFRLVCKYEEPLDKDEFLKRKRAAKNR